MNRGNRAPSGVIANGGFTMPATHLARLKSMAQKLRVEDLKYVLKEGQSKGFSQLRKQELQNRLNEILELFFEKKDYMQVSASQANLGAPSKKGNTCIHRKRISHCFSFQMFMVSRL